MGCRTPILVAGLLLGAVLSASPAVAQDWEIDPVTGLDALRTVQLDELSWPAFGKCLGGDMGQCMTASTAVHRDYLVGAATALLLREYDANPNGTMALPDGSRALLSDTIQVWDLVGATSEPVLRQRCAAGDCEAQARMDALLCAAGDGAGCRGLADLLQSGLYLSRNPAAASAVLMTGCVAGDAASCRRLGLGGQPASLQEGVAAAKQILGDDPRANNAACLGGDPLACVAAEAGRGALMFGDGFPLFTEALFSPAMIHGMENRSLSDLAEALMSLGAWKRADLADAPAVERPPEVPVAESGGNDGPAAPFGVNIYWGFGGVRSFTLKKQASAIRLGGMWHIEWFTFGLEGDWVTDNRWRPANKTYRRWVVLGKAGVDLPLHRALRLRLGGGGQVSSLSTPGGPDGGSAGTHQFVELAVNVTGFGRGKVGLLLALRFEQQQHWSPDRDDISVDHVGGGWLLVGFYAGPTR